MLSGTINRVNLRRPGLVSLYKIGCPSVPYERRKTFVIVKQSQNFNAISKPKSYQHSTSTEASLHSYNQIH